MRFTHGRKSVLQEWTESLSFMQQAVLIASVRGPDGIKLDERLGDNERAWRAREEVTAR